jgi:hypothetical protein
LFKTKAFSKSAKGRKGEKRSIKDASSSPVPRQLSMIDEVNSLTIELKHGLRAEIKRNRRMEKIFVRRRIGSAASSRREGLPISDGVMAM